MAGVKRKADDISQLEADDQGPALVPPYNVSTEISAKSVVSSDEYNKLYKGIRHVARRITEPLKKSEYKDASSVVKVVELTKQRLTENTPEAIMVSISGNMGSGMHRVSTTREFVLIAHRKKHHDQLYLQRWNGCPFREYFPMLHISFRFY